MEFSFFSEVFFSFFIIYHLTKKHVFFFRRDLHLPGFYDLWAMGDQKLVACWYQCNPECFHPHPVTHKYASIRFLILKMFLMDQTDELNYQICAYLIFPRTKHNPIVLFKYLLQTSETPIKVRYNFQERRLK